MACFDPDPDTGDVVLPFCPDKDGIRSVQRGQGPPASAAFREGAPRSSREVLRHGVL